jgi:hypothetical protein
MIPPRIEPVTGSTLAMLQPRLAGVAAELTCFRVITSGSFRGVWYETGDVLLCTGPSLVGRDEPVILVPHGYGKPQLGASRGGQLRGAYGELCSPGRWAVAGTVAAHVRRDALETADFALRGGWSDFAQPQLSLFGAIAA